ncbi:MAG: acetolactate synthase small subunit [Eubacteriales bacterium]
MKRNVISVLVENHPGVLTRISGLFSRRGYNINSLTVSCTENSELSRMTVLCTGDAATVEQIMKQLEKQEVVKKVMLLDEASASLGDVALVKMYAENDKRQPVMDVVNTIGATIINMGEKTITVQITGSYQHVDESLKALYKLDVAEVARTGLVGIAAGDERLIDHE